jgi:hypothetical protein
MKFDTKLPNDFQPMDFTITVENEREFILFYQAVKLISSKENITSENHNYTLLGVVDNIAKKKGIDLKKEIK